MEVLALCGIPKQQQTRRSVSINSSKSELNFLAIFFCDYYFCLLFCLLFHILSIHWCSLVIVLRSSWMRIYVRLLFCHYLRTISKLNWIAKLLWERCALTKAQVHHLHINIWRNCTVQVLLSGNTFSYLTRVIMSTSSMHVTFKCRPSSGSEWKTAKCRVMKLQTGFQMWNVSVHILPDYCRHIRTDDRMLNYGRLDSTCKQINKYIALALIK